MPTTYATPELREMMEKTSNATRPERRILIYHVTCPVNELPCRIQQCEYHQCATAAAEGINDNGQPLEPKIHITPIPQEGQHHTMPPIDYNHQWLKAVAEAALMMNQERLEELDAIQKNWGYPEYDSEAHTVIVEAMRTLAEIAGESTINQCRTCGKQHLLPQSDNCPGCQRLLDPLTERQECPSTTKVKA